MSYILLRCVAMHVWTCLVYCGTFMVITIFSTMDHFNFHALFCNVASFGWLILLAVPHKQTNVQELLQIPLGSSDSCPSTGGTDTTLGAGGQHVQGNSQFSENFNVHPTTFCYFYCFATWPKSKKRLWAPSAPKICHQMWTKNPTWEGFGPFCREVLALRAHCAHRGADTHPSNTVGGDRIISSESISEKRTTPKYLIIYGSTFPL